MKRDDIQNDYVVTISPEKLRSILGAELYMKLDSGYLRLVPPTRAGEGYSISVKSIPMELVSQEQRAVILFASEKRRFTDKICHQHQCESQPKIESRELMAEIIEMRGRLARLERQAANGFTSKYEDRLSAGASVPHNLPTAETLVELERQRRNLLLLICRILQDAPEYRLHPSELAVETVGDRSFLSREARACLLNRMVREDPAHYSKEDI